MSFDAVGFLEDHDISFRLHGQKTTKGWVQIEECPFCYGSNYYCGVNMAKSFFHCWYCGKSGKIEFLIQKLLKTRYENAKQLAQKYGSEVFTDEDVGPRAEIVSIAGLTSLQQMHMSYLQERQFDPRQLEIQYRIRACYTIGRFPYRIVIPVREDGILVNATARDVTGQQQERYMSLRNDEAIIPIKETVYNIDSVTRENILIVEGPFDVFRIGGATVCFFGTSFKMAQVTRVLSKFPKNVFILFDSEAKAQEQARTLGSCFSPFVEKVEILQIGKKDPAQLSPAEGAEIRKELSL